MSRFTPLVQEGQAVLAGDPIARTTPESQLQTVEVGPAIKRQGRQLARAIAKRRGDSVTEGEVLARSSGPFGFGKRQVVSPVSGVIRGVLGQDGVVVIRPTEVEHTVTSRVAGQVASVNDQGIGVAVEGRVLDAALVDGPDAFGVLTVIEGTSASADLARLGSAAADMPPRILAFLDPPPDDLLQLVQDSFGEHQPVALVVGGVSHGTVVARRGLSGRAPTLLLLSGYGGMGIHSGPRNLLRPAAGLPAAVVCHKESRRLGALILTGQHGGSVAIEPDELGAGARVTFLSGLRLTEGEIVSVDPAGRAASGYSGPAATVALAEGGSALIPVENLKPALPAFSD